ncbi:MAG: molybdate ABC transporter substrate-binding protein [Gammaproteobacteria bacterium]
MRATWFFLGLLLMPLAQAAEPVRLLAAGSLEGALSEVVDRFTREHDVSVEAKFGPSGTLRASIEGGEKADVFASADMAHPQALAKAGRGGPVTLFARNRLCALTQPGLGVTPDNLLPKMLDPDVRVATSTPGADPSGDYAFELFEKADNLKTGSEKTLKSKALQLTGAPDSAEPPDDRSAYAWHLREDRADIFLTYCTNAIAAREEDPDLETLQISEPLAVGADYGLSC